MTEPTLDPIAEHASDDAEPRLVRRYGKPEALRRATSAYVSLEQLAELVRGGETLRVVDTATGEDITAQTLTQVILDEGKRGRSLLPTELLHSALRRSAHVLDAGLGAARSGLDTLRHGVDDVAQGTLGRLSRALPALPGCPWRAPTTSRRCAARSSSWSARSPRSSRRSRARPRSSRRRRRPTHRRPTHRRPTPGAAAASTPETSEA
jgi:polyhydroxyalkanoate synthesis repressor PhaR